MIAVAALNNRCRIAVRKIALGVSAVDAPWTCGRDAMGSYRTLQDRRSSAIDKHCVRIAISMRARGDPTALQEPLLRCYGDLMAHHRVVTRTPSDGVGFQHAQSARRCPSFYAISRRSLAVPLRCHSVVAAMLAFPRRAGRHSGLFRSSSWCDSQFSICLLRLLKII